MNTEIVSSLACIVEAFKNSGWRTLSGSSYVVTKSFQGCNHEHQASTHIQIGADSICLTGFFWSEGRNVIASCMNVIPRTANTLEISSWVNRYVQHAEQLISESYSVRLYRRFGMHPDRPALSA